MPNGRRAAELIQADWAKIGVKAEIVTYEWGEYVKRARQGESKTAMFGGIWDFPDPSQIPNNYFTCNSQGKPSPSNIGSWCNATFNDLISRAGQITDQGQRADLYKQAQVVFKQEVPAFFWQLLGASRRQQIGFGIRAGRVWNQPLLGRNGALFRSDFSEPGGRIKCSSPSFFWPLGRVSELGAEAHSLHAELEDACCRDRRRDSWIQCCLSSRHERH